MKIYTKTGDKGVTCLLGGSRVPKDNIKIRVLGGLDEINASMGIAICFMDDKQLEDVRKILETLQSTLFSVGAEIARDLSVKMPETHTFTLQKEEVEKIEKYIDTYDEQLPSIQNFILPGGSKSASFLHLARTVVRRVERDVTKLSQKEDLNENIPKFVNRLSDLLFVFARYCNHVQEYPDINWEK